MAVLLWMKWSEGRMAIPGRSKRVSASQHLDNTPLESPEGQVEDYSEKSSPKKGANDADLPSL